MTPYRVVPLSNGLELELHDHSNRYFGDYHRIRIEIRCTIPLAPRFFAGDAQHPDLLRAQSLFGDALTFTRALERMGVAGDDVEKVREALVHDFLESTARYLEHPEFVRRYVAGQLRERLGGSASPV